MNPTRKDIPDIKTCLKMQYVEDIAFDHVTSCLDASEMIEGKPLTNDVEAFYGHYVRGFIDGWQEAKATALSDPKRLAFHALLGDLEIDL